MTRARELSRLGNSAILSIDSSYNVGIGSTIPDAKLDVTGIVSATSFYGNASNLSGIVAGSTLSAGSGAQRVVVTGQTSGTMTAAATDADLSWNSTTSTLSATTLSGNITGTAATFTGNVSIAGTITHEDVTNVDSVGVITSRDGIRVGASQSISPVSGTIAYYGDGSNLDGVESGVVNFVASGTLANGTPVILKADGTVGIITQTTGGPGGGTPVTFDPDAAEHWYPAVAYDTTNNKIVIGYKDDGNGGQGTAVVGTVSGTSITFGTPDVFGSSTTYDIRVVHDSTNDRMVFAYRDYTNSQHGKAAVGTVSGNSINFSSGPGTFNAATTTDIGMAYIGSGKVLISFKDWGNSEYGTAIIGTISGTTISFGSEYTYNAANSYFNQCAYIGSNKVVIAYRDEGNSNAATAIVATVSGTSISYGSENAFDGTPYLFQPIVSIGGDKVLIVYLDNDDGYKGKVIIGTVSGTSITFATPVTFHHTSTIQEIGYAYDTTNTKVIIAYKDQSTTYGTAVVGTVVGTSVTFTGSPVVYSDDSHVEFNSCAYDPDTDKTIIAYTDYGNSKRGKAVVFGLTSQVTNLTTENYIGITGEAIANAATGKVNVIGGVNSGQSGLTTNRKYYVGQTGILTTTADTPSVVAGTSISDTKILVWKS